MTATALVCPGQGSQRPGMGEAFYAQWRPFRRQFDELEDIGVGSALQTDLSSLCFEADANRLRQTAYTQPAVYAVGAAAAGAVRETCSLDITAVAGHSLGHFTAATAAGMLPPREGVSLVRDRGTAMEEAAADSPGRMVAILMADPETVTRSCRGLEDVSVAAYNTDRQTVISGDETAVDRALDRIRGRSARRVRTSELDVGAAFHSPLMTDATAGVEEAIQRVTLRPAQHPIVSDVTGEPYIHPRVARADLTEQVTTPVRWSKVVDTLRGQGVKQYVELPPAGTLAEFITRLHPDATVVALESPQDIQKLVP